MTGTFHTGTKRLKRCVQGELGIGEKRPGQAAGRISPSAIQPVA
jgi:hypothetical protein